MPLEATVTSKGQITLPKRLRDQLGLKQGSRIRFRLSARRRFEGEPIVLDLEDLWALADQGPRATMTTEEMDAAKARRRW
jgi:antitoxin PrlF